MNINDLLNLGTEDLRRLTKQKAGDILKQFAPQFYKSVETTKKWFTSRGLDVPYNFAEKTVTGVRSWSKADVSYNEKESLGRMKSKIRTIQKFYSSTRTSPEGIKQMIKEFRARIYTKMGKPEKANTRIGSYKKWYNFSNKFWEIADRFMELHPEIPPSEAITYLNEYVSEMDMEEFMNRDMDTILSDLNQRIKKEEKNFDLGQISFFDEEGNQ